MLVKLDTSQKEAAAAEHISLIKKTPSINQEHITNPITYVLVASLEQE